MVIGIDFDNTLISYDAVFHRLALEAGLIGTDFPAAKRAIRDAVRRSPQGEAAWQALQGQAYGPRMGEAQAAPGARAFLDRCRETGTPALVISHKTEFASVDPSRTPMRQAARGWLAAQGFGDLPVRFGATRKEKFAHIRAAGCTHFIDDLEETFLDPDFPTRVRAILYAPGGAPERPGLTVAPSWSALTRSLFGA